MNSLKAGQSQDLQTINAWLASWLLQGINPYYLPPGLTANYPPYAIAFLSPLTLIPQNWVSLVWGIINVAFAISAAFVAFRIISPNQPKKAAFLPCALFLSWAGLRIGLGNGQFSLLMLVFGLLAVVTSDKHPYRSGVFLGLSLMKPHIGVAFLLWALMTRRYKVSATATAVTLFGLLLFSVRIGESPVAAAADFLNILRRQFGGDTFLAGALELRPLVHFLIGNFKAAETVHLVILIGLLSLICWIAWHSRFRSALENDVVILQLSCLWALLAVFHNSYDSILMLPVMMGVYFSPWNRRQQLWQDKFPLWLVHVVLVVEVAGVWWKLSKRFDLSEYARAASWISHADRLLVLGCFLFVATRFLSARITRSDLVESETQLCAGQVLGD